jgi:hypothetical protein
LLCSIALKLVGIWSDNRRGGSPTGSQRILALNNHPNITGKTLRVFVEIMINQSRCQA